MLRKHLCVALLLLLLASLVSRSWAQESLADIAKQEREKKEQTGATPQVYTNQSLHPGAPTASATPTATANNSGKKPTPGGDIKGDAFAQVAMQTLAEKTYPESRVVPGNKLELPAGQQKSFQILGLTGHKVPSGWLYVGAIEFEEDQTAALKAMLTLQPASPALTYIFAFYLNAAGELHSFKRGTLDTRMAATQLDGFSFLTTTLQDGSWPVIDAIAWHWYSSSNWTGRVRFISKIDTTKMTVLERMPVAISKKPNDNDSIDDELTTEPLDRKDILIKGSFTHKSLRYPCPDHCIVDGERLLDGW